MPTKIVFLKSGEFYHAPYKVRCVMHPMHKIGCIVLPSSILIFSFFSLPQSHYCHHVGGVGGGSAAEQRRRHGGGCAVKDVGVVVRRDMNRWSDLVEQGRKFAIK